MSGNLLHKGPNKFCTVIDLPSEDLYTDDHYLFLVAGGAAELITTTTKTNLPRILTVLHFPTLALPL